MSTGTSIPVDKNQNKPTVDEAKQRVMEVFQSIDLLKPLKDHPFVVVGAAATVGAVLGSSGKAVAGLSSFTTGLLRLVKPISGIVGQLAAAKLAAQTVNSNPASSETPEVVPEDVTV